MVRRKPKIVDTCPARKRIAARINKLSQEIIEAMGWPGNGPMHPHKRGEFYSHSFKPSQSSNEVKK